MEPDPVTGLGKAFIIRTKSGSHTLNRMKELVGNYFETKGTDTSHTPIIYQIDPQTSFPIYPFPIGDFPALLTGPLFGSIQAQWFTVFENYLIFSDTYSAMKQILHANTLGETLDTNIEFNKFQSALNTRCTFQFFCNTDRSLSLAPFVLNKELGSVLEQNHELKKFKMFAWQISPAGSMMYNNASLLFYPEIQSKPQTVWKSHMKASFDFKPLFVKNHTDPLNKEIVLQDRENNFYLINNIGRIQWQIKLPSPILSDIHQIDLFKNGKYQFLFNTSEKIYVIDRNGNSVPPFPITLRSEASNGVAVFDYENTRNYRFIVACSDRTLYAYDNQASFVEGWNNPKTDHPISHPVEHFVVDGKDYIVAADKMKDYFFDRRGNVRVETNTVYPHSSRNSLFLEKRSPLHEPHIVTTDPEGNIHRTYFNGEHEMIEFKKLSENHFFVAGNLDTDESLEYVFADEHLVYTTKNNGKVLFTKKLEYPISHMPVIYHFSYKEKKVGLTCSDQNKIFLFDINGNLHPGFPLDGCSGFSIGLNSEDETNFNLLVASPEGYLYNYYVE